MRGFPVLLLMPLLANAEDPSISRFLKEEPATLLDIGMIRLDGLTKEFARRVGVYWTTASGTSEAFRADISSWYDADDDRIHVHFHVADSVAVDTQMKEGCEMAMDQIAIWISKSLPGLFMHAGYDNTVEAAKPFNTAGDLIEISCYVSAANDSSIGRFWARRSLRNPELTIGPWT